LGWGRPDGGDGWWAVPEAGRMPRAVSGGGGDGRSSGTCSGGGGELTGGGYNGGPVCYAYGVLEKIFKK
jgi:hypothetical protein